MSNDSKNNSLKNPSDIQETEDTRNVYIDFAGIKEFRIPIKIWVSDERFQDSVAIVDAHTSLKATKRGVHLSKIIHAIKKISEVKINYENLSAILSELARIDNSNNVSIIIKFAYFKEKTSPVSSEKMLLDYDCTLIGKVLNGHQEISLQVKTPIMTLCPDSKELTGCAAHNQRATAIITATGDIWIDDLINVAEKSGSSEIYQILRKADDKYVMENAYNNPKFAEDFVRDAILRLREDKRIINAKVEIESYESNHNYNAYATAKYNL